jgi:hypothetical protein
MSQMLRYLRQDHDNLQKLLFVLERQIAALDRREGPDWDIIEGAIDYLLTYPGLRHHPMEDRILRRLQTKDPSAAAPFRSSIPSTASSPRHCDESRRRRARYCKTRQ